MTADEPTVLPADAPPKSGEWVDPEDFFGALTPEEAALGEHLGAETDDDDYVEDE